MVDWETIVISLMGLAITNILLGVFIGLGIWISFRKFLSEIKESMPSWIDQISDTLRRQWVLERAMSRRVYGHV